MRGFFVVLALTTAALIPACSGCENSVCCALPGRALPSIVRPSACTSMGGAPVATAMCEAVCCEASDGTRAPGPRMTCTRIVEPRLCDVPDGG